MLRLTILMSLAVTPVQVFENQGSIPTDENCVSAPNSVCTQEEERCKLLRSKLKYNLRPDLPCGKPFERGTFHEILKRPEIRNYSFPFVMTESVKGYEPLKDLDWLVEKFGEKLADFFPYNDLTIENNLHVYRFKNAMKEFKTMPGEGVLGDLEINHPAAKRHPGKYLKMTLTEQDWSALPIHEHRWLAQDFWATCLKDELKDEHFIKTHWKMILIGQPGAGMKNHRDALRSSTWHLHVTGRKWWRVCYNDECFEEILSEGDTLFYPRDWFHTTQCLEMPTTTLASQIVTDQNKITLINELWSTCFREKHRFWFSGRQCDALEACYDAIGVPVRHWRTLASESIIRKRDKPDAWKNWYHFNTINGETS